MVINPESWAILVLAGSILILAGVFFLWWLRNTPKVDKPVE